LVARMDIAGTGQTIQPERSSLQTLRWSKTSLHRKVRQL